MIKNEIVVTTSGTNPLSSLTQILHTQTYQDADHSNLVESLERHN